MLAFIVNWLFKDGGETVFEKEREKNIGMLRIPRNNFIKTS
jgi:hypothetical protein